MVDEPGGQAVTTPQSEVVPANVVEVRVALDVSSLPGAGAPPHAAPGGRPVAADVVAAEEAAGSDGELPDAFASAAPDPGVRGGWYSGEDVVLVF